MSGLRLAAGCLHLLLLVPLTSTAVAELDPYTLAAELAELGPRVPGTTAHAAARQRLLGVMAEVGLVEIASVEEANGSINLSGRLAGAGSSDLLLSAHYDSVALSPGAGDDASGCAVVLAAVEELRRAPLRGGVRVVLFDREEGGGLGSRAWLERQSPAERAAMRAALALDMVGGRDRTSATLLPFPAAGSDGTRRAPGWLVAESLGAARAVSFPLAIADPNFPLLGQVALRTFRLRLGSDAESFLAHGIPAVVLSDSSLGRVDPAHHQPEDRPQRLDPARLMRWSLLVAAMVRRIDALEQEPRWQEEYLVIGGRVLSRPVLAWAGFIFWMLLVWRGIPGPWRRVSANERRSRGRGFLGRFAFRAAFLIAVLTAPAVALPLLSPGAAAILLAPRGRPISYWALALAWAPVLALGAGTGVVAAQGLLLSWGLSLLPTLALLAAWVTIPAALAPSPLTASSAAEDEAFSPPANP